MKTVNKPADYLKLVSDIHSDYEVGVMREGDFIRECIIALIGYRDRVASVVRKEVAELDSTSKRKSEYLDSLYP